MKLKNILLSLLPLICLKVAIADTASPVAIERWQTSNGTPVYYSYLSSLPIVDVIIAFDAGSARDGNRYGIANITNQMLYEGTEKLSADQIAAGFDNVGAVYGGRTDRDKTLLSFRSLIEPNKLQPALHTFSQVLAQPVFPLQNFERLKKQMLDNIHASHQHPSNIASEAIFSAIYPQHPYAHPIVGTGESVAQLEIKDIQRFYQKFFVANNAVLVIVGAVEQAQAKAMAEKITSGLTKGKQAELIPAVEKFPRARNIHITFPAAQTNILIGQPFIKMNDPDYYALKVANYSLGGGDFASRLTHEVREKRGLVYGASSDFEPLKSKGPFIVSLATKNSQVPSALKITRKVIAEFVDKGPNEQEVQLAKQNIIGSFAIKLSSNSALAGALLNIAFYHLPTDYLETYKEKINKVSRAEVSAAFKKHLDVKHLVTVSVGDEQEQTH